MPGGADWGRTPRDVENVCRSSNGVRSMGRHEDRTPGGQSIQGAQHKLFGGGIQVRGRLVQQEKVGVGEQCTGEGQALALSAGQESTAAQRGVEAPGQPGNGGLQTDLVQCVPQCVVGYVGAAPHAQLDTSAPRAGRWEIRSGGGRAAVVRGRPTVAARPLHQHRCAGRSLHVPGPTSPGGNHVGYRRPAKEPSTSTLSHNCTAPPGPYGPWPRAERPHEGTRTPLRPRTWLRTPLVPEVAVHRSSRPPAVTGPRSPARVNRQPK